MNSILRSLLICAAALVVYPAGLFAQANPTWDATTGTTGAQDGAGTWNTSNTNWWNGSANVNYLGLNQIALVPEPSASILALASCGLLLRRRRR